MIAEKAETFNCYFTETLAFFARVYYYICIKIIPRFCAQQQRAGAKLPRIACEALREKRMDIAKQKSAQRAAGIAARRALSAAARAAASAAICRRAAALPEFQAARTILLYAAFGAEADLSALAAEAARQGKVVAYPVCGADFSLTAAVPDADGWETGAYGIRAPVLARSRLLEPAQLDLVLVPCTAFDAACRRVGMGKGYYDRFLPRCTGAAAVGAAFEAQRVEAVAADIYDRRLDAFLTEREVYRGI